MSALSTRDTGQLALAPAATSANFSGDIPGTMPVVLRWSAVIVQLVCGWFSNVRAAVVVRLSATNPAASKAAESAMVKHPAWAAAMSSSGLVPEPAAKRELKEYGVCLRTALSVDRVPLPFLRLPCQIADAFRFMGDQPRGVSPGSQGRRRANRRWRAVTRDPLPSSFFRGPWPVSRRRAGQNPAKPASAPPWPCRGWDSAGAGICLLWPYSFASCHRPRLEYPSRWPIRADMQSPLSPPARRTLFAGSVILACVVAGILGWRQWRAPVQTEEVAAFLDTTVGAGNVRFTDVRIETVRRSEADRQLTVAATALTLVALHRSEE